MKAAGRRIAMLSLTLLATLAALVVGAHVIGCGGGEGGDPGTLLDVTGWNNNVSSGLNVHLWATEGPAQATAQVSPESLPGGPIAPTAGRTLLSKTYYAHEDGRRDLPQYITVHAGRNDATLGTKRVNLPAQTYSSVSGQSSPSIVDVDVTYTDGVGGPVWTVSMH
jgi:hypothetical protein